MPAKSKQRGQIQTHFLVRCGANNCTNLRDKTAATLEAAQAVFEGEGWANSETHGWLCPQHTAAYGVRLPPPVPGIELLNRWQLRDMLTATRDDLVAAKINGEAGRVAYLKRKADVIESEFLKRQHGDF